MSDKRSLYFCRTREVCTSVGQERFVLLSDKRGLHFCRTREVCTSVGQERFVFLSDKIGLYFLYDGYNGSLTCSFIKQ